MPRRRKGSEDGLVPHFKVRLVLPGALIHLASQDEPRWVHDEDGQRQLEADWITDPDYGDTLFFIDWSAVTGVTWRWSE